MQKERRDFLKITAAGAAGLALTRADKAFAAWPGTGTMAVNPNIDNMRVVACYDTKMMKSQPTSMTFANENAAVDSARVQANMDAMAMQLANQTTADAAWKAIFRTGKTSWAATKVAIKVNTISSANMARVAVVQKFCTIFAGFGVLPANLIIYDGQSAYASGTSLYTTYFSTTDATKTPAVVSNLNSALGGTVSAPIPGGTSATCTADIANGVIDILIDIANNKGHDLVGKTTLCMKNHFGTFAPKHDLNYMFNINKSDAILGGNPVRQQLCFVDSLLANKTGMSGAPEAMPCYLIMGVFAPAVDYLTVKKVREAVMGCTHDSATIDSFLTTFGYATTDPVWVLVPPAGGGTGADGGAGGAGGTSGSGGAGSGGTSAAGGARSGGTSGSGGVASGGASGSGGVASGGTSGSGGARSGGTSAAGGAGSGGTSGAGGVRSGGTSGSGGAGSGGTSGSGGAGSGGTTAAGGTPGSGGTTSGGTGGTGGAATSSAYASGGSATTGGTSAGTGTSANSTGGSSGSTKTTGATPSSSGGCDVAGVDRRATRWGAMLAFGAVVAEKLRRLVSGSDRST